MDDARTTATGDEILTEIKAEIVRTLGTGLTPASIRGDVDLFDGSEPLVVGRPLDSMDLVHVIAVLEAHFGISFTAVLDDEDSLTLRQVADRIAEHPGTKERR